MFLKKSSAFKSCSSEKNNKTLSLYRVGGDIWGKVSEGDKTLYKKALIGGDNPGRHIEDTIVDQDGPGGLLSHMEPAQPNRRQRLRIQMDNEKSHNLLTEKSSYEYVEQRDDEEGRSGFSDALNDEQRSQEGLRNSLPTEITILDTQGHDGKGDMEPKEYAYSGSYGGAANINYLDDLQMQERSRINELNRNDPRRKIKMRRR